MFWTVETAYLLIKLFIARFSGMGRYVRKCKRSRDAVVETTPEIGARMTRASMAQQALEKKRKFGLGESEITESLVRLQKRLLAVAPPGNSDLPVTSVNSKYENQCSDHVLASCCSGNGSIQLAKRSTDFVDLEIQEENEEFSAISGGDLEERRETTSSCEEESTAMPRESNSRRRSMAEKTPSEVELEEFFSAAETKLHNQFIDKYNYDIVKDEPLVGHYEWVRVLVKP